MKVSEELVRREIEFKEGEFYSRSLILKSEANLSQTGLFEYVRNNLEQTGKADTVNLADVNVWVVPRNKHDIFPSIYFSDERNEQLNLMKITSTALQICFSAFCFPQDPRCLEATLKCYR